MEKIKEAFSVAIGIIIMICIAYSPALLLTFGNTKCGRHVVGAEEEILYTGKLIHVERIPGGGLFREPTKCVLMFDDNVEIEVFSHFIPKMLEIDEVYQVYRKGLPRERKVRKRRENR